MQRTQRYRRIFLLILDILSINLAFNLAFIARFNIWLYSAHNPLPWAPSERYIPLEFVVTIAWLIGSVAARRSRAVEAKTQSEWSMLAKSLFFLTGLMLIFIVAQG